MNDDELLDLVDSNDNVVGTIMRSKTSQPFKGFVRAAELLLLNDEGKVWIPRRQMHKKIAPGGLDYSAAGHVTSGDTYEETILRETEEELNLVLDRSKLEFVHKFPPKKGMPPYFRAVYIYRSNKTPIYNPGDFSEASWEEPRDLLAKLQRGEPAKESLQETIQYLVDNIAK